MPSPFLHPTSAQPRARKIIREEPVMGDTVIITEDEPKPAPKVVVVVPEPKKTEQVVTEKMTVTRVKED